MKHEDCISLARSEEEEGNSDVKNNQEFGSLEINFDPAVGGEEYNGEGESIHKINGELRILYNDEEQEEKEEEERIEVATKKEIFAWFMYDWANSVYVNTVTNSFLPPYITKLAKNIASRQGGEVVYPLGQINGLGILYSSFFQICVSISVVLQCICFVLFGAIADYGGLRKKLLIVTSTIGAVCTMGFFIVDADTSGILVLNIAALLFIIGNTAFGCSVIYYNSFLPLLADAHPTVIAAKREERLRRKQQQQQQLADVDSGDNIDAGTTTTTEKKESGGGGSGPNQSLAVEEVVLLVDKQLSTLGFVCGYAAGFILLVINIVIFVVIKTGNWATRINLASAGVWWFGFSLITFVWLKPRRSPALPPTERYLTIGVKRIVRTIRNVRRIPYTFLFLLAYLIYADAISTIGAGASILASEELEMSSEMIGIAFLEMQIIAIGGNFLYYYLSKRIRWFTSKRVLLWHLLLFCFVPIYAIVALRSKWEFFFLAAIWGMHIGSIQAFSRSIYSRMIPKGLEAEFFAFYEFTDKGTSWFGPLVMAGINQVTGSLRWGLCAIALFFLAGLVITAFVNVEKGIADVQKLEADATNAAGNNNDNSSCEVEMPDASPTTTQQQQHL